MSSLQTLNNEHTYQQLCRRIPGGVNSPFRAFQAVGGTPPILCRGEGSRVWDIEGKEYVDFCCAWGPLMLGHSHPTLKAALHQAIEEGCVFGASTPWELDFAEAISQAYPSMQMLRLVNSGAEAVASALRVARGVTRRPRILKFEGCYHGHVECLDSVGIEAEELGGALALGASPASAQETLIAEFNNLESVSDLLQSCGSEIAAIIVEPIPGSMTVVRPEPEFLSGLRTLCDQHQVLLIFDEVLSGCRVALGGAQEIFGIQPDLTCLGKALAGGMPIGAYGGKREFMEQVAPLGPIYQAGTFCGNPLTVRCGLANLQYLGQPNRYSQLAALTEDLCGRLRGLDPQLQVVAYPGMFGLYFAPQPVTSHRQLASVDQPRFAKLFHHLLQGGFYLPPSCLDAAGLSLVHTSQEIEEFVTLLAKGLS